MLNFSSLLTIGTRYFSLVSNFLLVVLSVKIWGSEGRGEIALMITNISIINIITNISCGSSIAFNSKKNNPLNLFVIIAIGGFVFSLMGSLIFSAFYKFNDIFILFSITFLMSIATGISSIFLGLTKVKIYNNLMLLSSITALIILFIAYRFNTSIGLYYYFYSLLVANIITIFVGLYLLRNNFQSFNFNIQKNQIFDLLRYGFKNEINNFFQFLSYRFSFYLIAMNYGLKTLGIFSIAISLAEAIWVISRSLSTVHYANVLNSNNFEANIKNTIKNANFSFVLSCTGILVLMLIPDSFYSYLFTKEFENVKTMVLFISPGILLIAYSNLHLHYFSATNQQNILIVKSVMGFMLCLTFLYLLKSDSLKSIFIAMNIAYIVPSIYLVYKFFENTSKSTIR